MEKRRLLTIPEAAKELDLTRATVWKLVKSGKLPHSEVAGRFKLIDWDALQVFKATKRDPGWPKGRPRKPAG